MGLLSADTPGLQNGLSFAATSLDPLVAGRVYEIKHLLSMRRYREPNVSRNH